MKKWQIISGGLLVLTCMVIACKKNSNLISFAKNNQIFGTLYYNDLLLGLQPVPKGQKVKVSYNGTENSAYNFTTTDSGAYQLIPMAEGSYQVNFTLVDSLLQYDSTLVEKADIDTTRKSFRMPISYTGQTAVVSVNTPNVSAQQNVTLATVQTGLKLTLTDNQSVPLPNIKVCLYSNAVLASQNAPYCGGCIAYLSSDQNGNIVYTGLQPVKYYINARGKIGTVLITNQWSDAMKSTPVLSAGKITPQTIMLQ